MIFLDPIWLLLLFPLAWALGAWRPPSRWLLGLRALGWLALLLALCRPVAQLPSRGGTVVLVADRSASMPDDEAARHEEALALLSRARPQGGGGFRLGVVTFGAAALVEQPPQAGPVPRLRIPRDRLGRDGSDLAAAVAAALALIPPGEPGRLLVASDGRWSGGDPAAVAGRAALRGIPIDVRPLARATTGDLAVASIEAPAEVRPGEAFTVTAWVQSPTARPVRYRLVRGDRVLAAGERTLSAGRGRLLFRDRAGAPGSLAYRLEIEDAAPGAPEDPQPGNNTARWLTGVRGPRPVLVVSPGAVLADLLRRGGVEVEGVSSDDARWDLPTLSGYSAVLLDGIPADAVGEAGLATLAAWVEGGGGLLLTGGKASYGTGGYFRSPLEPVLPVSMELRQEHRKLAVAVVVALDRSGSMGVTVGDGRTKMDLANLAAVQVLDLLTSMDEFGLVVVDSQAHIIAPLRSVEDLATSRQAMLRVESMGGGIYVYEALEAAAEQLLKAQAGTRHILLFADAADSEHPHAYRALLDQARAAGITVSVVGLGQATDVDANLLRDIAERGGGRAYFTQSAEALPRLFAQDTFLVARSAFLDEPTPIRATGALSGLTGLPAPPTLPPVGGYNLTYLRPGADLAIVTQDAYQAPLVASWQAGLGRVVAYTAPFTAADPALGGDFPGGIARWSGYGALLAGLTRWSAGAGEELAPGLLVRQRATPSGAQVALYLDPERDADPFTAAPTVTVVRAAPERAPVVEQRPLVWVSPDRLELEVPLRGDEVVTSTIEVPGAGRRTLAPARLPYPPELRPAEPGSGLATLEALARATGGRRIGDLGQIWDTFPRTPRQRPLAPYLALLAAFLLLLEVLERRTAMLSHGVARVSLGRFPGRATKWLAPLTKWLAPAGKRVASTESVVSSASTESTESTESAAPAEAAVAASDSSPGEPTAETGTVLDALEKARRRARGRTEG